MTPVTIEHNWSMIGPGGHYGVFQYHTGPGVLDVQTAVLIGPHIFRFPCRYLQLPF